jgi:hypothetical protein
MAGFLFKLETAAGRLAEPRRPSSAIPTMSRSDTIRFDRTTRSAHGAHR